MDQDPVLSDLEGFPPSQMPFHKISVPLHHRSVGDSGPACNLISYANVMISAKGKPHKILTAKMMLDITESRFDSEAPQHSDGSRPFIQTAGVEIFKVCHGSYVSKFLVETIWYVTEREITRPHLPPVRSMQPQ